MGSPSLLFRMATVALRRNRLRTALSIVSLSIGIAAVTTIASLGRGARAVVQRQMAQAGTNMIVVSAGNWTSGGVRLGMGSSSKLVNADADAIARSVAGVADVSPGVRTRQQLVNGTLNWSANVEGVGEDLLSIRHWPVAAGAFFDTSDVEAAAEVCVIGASIRDALFESTVDPVGRQIRVGIQILRVIGVLARKGESAGGEDQDDSVFVPYTTAQKKLMGVQYLRNITVSSRTAEQTAQVAADIRSLLRLRHEIGPQDTEDFRVRTLDEIVALRTRTSRTMTMLLAAAAAVSLMVGGIGVMNIMLASVVERTHEIGLRLAVGARTRDVLSQFLAEALLLSLAGGLGGIALGFGLAKALTAFLAWPTEVAAATAFIAVGFSAAVGIFFGLYPAVRAASVDPIEALRWE